MNKRLLSLLLVLCMVLVSVPVLALPLSAAGNETAIYKYTSSYTDNLVTANGTSPVFHGNWSVVAYTPGDYSSPASATAVSWVGASGNYNGLATTGGNGFLSISATNGNYQGIGTVGSNTSQSMAVRYTAEKTGTADIIFDKLGQIGSGAIGTYTYYVYVNGQQVWPANGETNKVTGPNAVGQSKTALIYDDTTVAVKGVSLKAGDVVDFICEGDQASNLWGNGGNAMFGTIAYTSVAATHTTSYSNTSNAPTQANNAMIYSGNWTVRSFTTGAYAYDSTTLINWAGTSGNYANLGTSGGSAFVSWGNSNANYHGATATVGSNNAQSALVRYTAEYDGVADIYFDKLGNLAAMATGTFTYNVYKNGVKIWPLNGETNTAVKATKIYDTKTQIVANLALNAGDVIDFTCENDAAATLWGNGGNAMFATIDYTTVVAPAAYSSSYTNNLPTQENNVPVYSGNWTAMTTKAGTGTYDYANLVNISWAGTSGNYNGLATSGGAAFVSWSATNANYYGAVGAVGACATQAAVIRYTAEKNGVANISFDKLGQLASASNGNFTYTVYVNGVKVWPANGENNKVAGPNSLGTGSTNLIYDTKTAVVSNITLAIGDKIDFVCESDAAATLWGNGGNAMFATIDYTELMPAASATATVSVGATVNATASVVMPAEVYFPAEIGLYVDGVKIPGATAAILTDVAIKDIESKSVTVAAYYTTTQGAEIVGAETTVTVADLLKTVGGAKANAVLNYAAAAQAYFGIEGTLTYTAPTLNGTYTDQLAIVGEKLADARVIPTEVALLLKDTVSFKFAVSGAEDGDVLKMTNGEDVAEFVIENGVVTVDGIGIDNWNTLYTFVIEDETDLAVSSTFTYSVSTYYARMQGGDANLANLVTAMMALYEATL